MWFSVFLISEHVGAVLKIKLKCYTGNRVVHSPLRKQDVQFLTISLKAFTFYQREGIFKSESDRKPQTSMTYNPCTAS